MSFKASISALTYTHALFEGRHSRPGFESLPGEQLWIYIPPINPFCRQASNSTTLTVLARFILRDAAIIGIRNRCSALNSAWISFGRPLVSRPNSSTSPGLNCASAYRVVARVVNTHQRRLDKASRTACQSSCSVTLAIS